MRDVLTSVLERDGKWWVATCPEVPGANGQGSTREDCLKNLEEAIELILDESLAAKQACQ